MLATKVAVPRQARMDEAKECVMVQRTRYRLRSALMFLLAASLACATKTPVDLHSASRAEAQEAECSRDVFEAITLLLNSPEFQSSLAAVEEQDIYLGPNRRKLVALWGRGTPDGIEGERPYHPTVMVALDDIELVPTEVVDLLRLLDRVGAEAFGGSYTKILPTSSQ